MKSRNHLYFSPVKNNEKILQNINYLEKIFPLDSKKLNLSRFRHKCQKEKMHFNNLPSYIFQNDLSTSKSKLEAEKQKRIILLHNKEYKNNKRITTLSNAPRYNTVTLNTDDTPRNSKSLGVYKNYHYAYETPFRNRILTKSIFELDSIQTNAAFGTSEKKLKGSPIKKYFIKNNIYLPPLLIRMKRNKRIYSRNPSFDIQKKTFM